MNHGNFEVTRHFHKKKYISYKNVMVNYMHASEKFTHVLIAYKALQRLISNKALPKPTKTRHH